MRKNRSLNRETATACVACAAITAAITICSVVSPNAAVADIGPVAVPEHVPGGTRALLVEPAPYPTDRARLVTRHNRGAVAPDFVVAGPPYSREPVIASRQSRRGLAGDLGAHQFMPEIALPPTGVVLPPNMTLYGPEINLYDIWTTGPRAHARVGSQIIRFDPFARVGAQELDQVQIARRIWLNEHGYVQRARVLQRGVHRGRVVISGSDWSAAPSVTGAADDNRGADGLPKPRAIIKIRRNPVETPFEAKVPAPTEEAGSEHVTADASA